MTVGYVWCSTLRVMQQSYWNVGCSLPLLYCGVTIRMTFAIHFKRYTRSLCFLMLISYTSSHILQGCFTIACMIISLATVGEYD